MHYSYRNCTDLQYRYDSMRSDSDAHIGNRHYSQRTSLAKSASTWPSTGVDNGKTGSIRKTAMQIYYRPMPKCIFEFERIRFSTLFFPKPTLVPFHARCRPPAEPCKPIAPYANITRSRGREMTNLVVLCRTCF